MTDDKCKHPGVRGGFAEVGAPKVDGLEGRSSAEEHVQQALLRRQ